MFDYLPLDRPMLFFRPDHAELCRELAPAVRRQARERWPGADLAYRCRELVAALQGDLAALDAPYVAVREELTARLFDRIDDRASERVAQLIEEELELALAARG